MTEQNITKKTAILAKSKGFYLHGCTHSHKDGSVSTSRGEGQSLSQYKTRIKYIYFKEGYPCFDYKPEDLFIICSQSLLQRWLRDKHRIFIDIRTDQTTEPKFGFEMCKFIGNPKDLTKKEWCWYGESGFILYKTYELALEAALQVALNEIKNK